MELDALIQQAEQRALEAAKNAPKQGPKTHARQIEPEEGEPEVIAKPLLPARSGTNPVSRRYRSQLEADERRRKFARGLFFSGFDAEQAFLAAGYKATRGNIAKNMTNMLKEPVVRDELERLTRAAREAIEAEAFDATKHWIELATSNIMDFLVQNDEGMLSLRPDIKAMPESKQRQIKKVKIRRTTTTSKDGDTYETVDTEIELWDKPKSLEALSRIGGLYKDSLGDALKDFAGILTERLNRMSERAGRTFTQDGDPVEG